MPAALYLVATPIGNLEDITHRAVRILREVSLIACEDTRQTAKILGHYGITTTVVSYHEHNENSRAPELVKRLLDGESVALVSDAGTPLVSDPGYRLVQSAIEQAIPVVPVPGPSAALAALGASGLPTHAFRFRGFLPPKQSQRRKILEAQRGAEETLVVYEAPHRILAALRDVEAVLGPRCPVVVARELTKVHEEFIRGEVGDVIRTMQQGIPRGEMTLLIAPAPSVQSEPSVNHLQTEVDRLIADGVPRMDAIKKVAALHRLGKRDLYKALETTQGRGGGAVE